MVLFSIGMPSRLAEWCDMLIARLAEPRLGTVERVALNTLDDIAVAVVKTRAPNLLVCSRQPVGRLQSEIVQSTRPFVVSVGDPRIALADLVERAGYDIATATRGAASSCAAMLNLIKAPGALVIAIDDGRDPTTVAAQIAGHLDLPASGDEIAEIVAELAAAGFTPHFQGEDRATSGLGERDQAVVNGALLPYVSHMMLRQDLKPLVWEPELFFINENAPAPQPAAATRPVDVTGRVRHLVYGPFIDLPPGPWSANVVLGFSPETAGTGFVVEVFTGRQLAHTRIEAAAEQIIEADLHFVLDHTETQPVQIRVANERAAFDGRLALGCVTLTPQATISSDTRERLATILRK